MEQCVWSKCDKYVYMLLTTFQRDKDLDKQKRVNNAFVTTNFELFTT